ncbi:hypothetical protein NKG05_08990 [Oerskovia sp. M15]
MRYISIMPTATSSPPSGKPFRMTEQAYLILLALTPEPLHGYAVIRAVAELSDGATALGPHAVRKPGPPLGREPRRTLGEEVVDGRLRRYYRITDDGRRVAEQETVRLRELAARAQKALDRRDAAARPTSGGSREGWPDAPGRPDPGERLERSTRFWARAYPRRWREVHGDELLAVQQDVALAAAEATGAPAPTRLSADEIRGLLRAGWGLRWREHPPLWRWVLYRFGLRLPARYWWWVADDIRGAFYAVRDYACCVGLMYGLMAAIIGSYALIAGEPGVDYWPGFWSSWVSWAVVALVALSSGTVFRKSRTRDAWYRHVVYGNVPDVMRPALASPNPRTPHPPPDASPPSGRGCRPVRTSARRLRRARTPGRAQVNWPRNPHPPRSARPRRRPPGAPRASCGPVRAERPDQLPEELLWDA